MRFFSIEYQTYRSQGFGLAVGDVVRILKQGTQAGTEAVVTNPDVDGEKEITVLRTSGPKTGRSAMYAKDEVKRTGKTMLPEQIEEIRRGVPAALAGGERIAGVVRISAQSSSKSVIGWLILCHGNASN